MAESVSSQSDTSQSGTQQGNNNMFRKFRSENGSSKKLVFFVNGKKVEDENPDPSVTLLFYLRNKLMLPGTKEGCSQGACGACTVMVSYFDRQENKIRHESVVACLVPVCSLHGKAVTTVEGVGSIENGLHPVQERLSRSHGTQCGFCSPGMVMSMYTLLRNTPKPTTSQIRRVIQGNLCRCTGYRPILDGFNTFAKDFECPMGEDCCKNEKNSQGTGNKNKKYPGLVDPRNFAPYEPTQEPIFPSELQLNKEYQEDTLIFQNGDLTWQRPRNLKDLYDLTKLNQNYRMIAGHTDIGFSVKNKSGNGEKYTEIIDISHVPELKEVKISDDGVVLGGAISLSKAMEVLEDILEKEKGQKTLSFSTIVGAIGILGTVQIRNMATLGGHLAVAPWISDLIPIMVATQCSVTIYNGHHNSSKMSIENFLKDENNLYGKAIIQNVIIPKSSKSEYITNYHQTDGRRDLRSTVNAAMRVSFKGKAVNDISIIYNGLGKNIFRKATNTENLLIGKECNDSIFEAASQALTQELAPDDGLERKEYRRALVLGYFFKFLTEVNNFLNNSSGESIGLTPITGCSGSQVFEEVPPDQQDEDPVWRPIAHVAADKHTTGQAQFIDDLPSFKGELFLALVKSTEAHAELVSIDASVALAMPGIHGMIDHKDIKNNQLPMFNVFPEKEVEGIGQPIAGILGESFKQAREAADRVKVTYKPLKPILSIEEAIEAKSYYEPFNEVEMGDVEQGFKDSYRTVEGEVEMGGQLHYYMETHRSLVVPRDGGELEVFAGVQNPTTGQRDIIGALGLPQHKVICRTKRLGGAFGGKEVQGTLFAIFASAAAIKYKRPVRCILSRNEDKPVTGGRHPALMKYKIGFDKNGKYEAMSIQLYVDAGRTMDASVGMLHNMVVEFNNCYHCPNVHVIGKACKTNFPSNTALRGFGSPQATWLSESLIDHIARELRQSPEQIREINLQKNGNVLPTGQKLEVFNAEDVWKLCKSDAGYDNKVKEIETFNRENKWRKRGIAITTQNMGPGFVMHHMHQGNALVQVYLDGTVLLATGSTEMGQGLNTKLIQVASRELGVPMDLIHIAETATNLTPNGTMSAGSVACDVVAPAVVDACQMLSKRIEPFKAALPDGGWVQWVNKAYEGMVSLSAVGYHRWMYENPMNIFTKKGHNRPYLTHGAACTEVEVDCLTGQHKLIRTDIVNDLGKSLNPAIDVGQIEGAFMIGYGLFAKEEVVFDDKGGLTTSDPLTYRIARCTDIPGQLNVRLLKDSPNPKAAIYSSKAVGEPPLLLAASVFFAIKSAVAAARADHGHDGPFRLDSPATADRVRMAIGDKMLDAVKA